MIPDWETNGVYLSRLLVDLAREGGVLNCITWTIKA
jgi:hypothetical protein